MGAQGGIGASSHGRATSRKDGYALVSRVGPAIRIGGALHQGARKVQRSADRRTISLHYRNLQHTENTPLRSDGMRWGA